MSEREDFQAWLHDTAARAKAWQDHFERQGQPLLARSCQLVDRETQRAIRLNQEVR